MIPKIIHYCWFGEKELPQVAINYIETWKRIFPNYEIIEWNEKNFDITKHHYTKQAYEAKKYAFVSDYCRLFVLKEYGGIYFDTDVEVLKSFDPLLINKAFIGFEDFNKIGTSVIGAVKNSEFINEIINLYDEIQFINEKGKLNLTPNVNLITNYILDQKVILDGSIVDYQNKLKIYSKDYFSPKVFDTEKIYCTDNTYSIHHFSQSWNSKMHFIIQKIKRILIFFLGFKTTRKIIKFIKNE